MGAEEHDRARTKAETDRRAEELGRKAARLLKRGKPRVQQAVEEARPRAEQVAKGAWHFTQEHEDEIKRAALRGARLKVRGPFGFVIDALSSGLRNEEAVTSAGAVCSACGAGHEPLARFCGECGARLTTPES